MDHDRIKAKLRKLLALAQQGVGGEKENAQRMMETLMRKYDLSLEDFSDEAVVKDYEFVYKDQWTKDLYRQIMSKVLDSRQLKIFRYRGAGGKAGRTFILQCTAAQHAEIQMLFEIYSRQLKKELDLFFIAFLNKHKLFAASPQDDDSAPSREYSDEEIEALLQMMGSMKAVTIHKQIGHTR